jgi:hypothetical protein
MPRSISSLLGALVLSAVISNPYWSWAQSGTGSPGTGQPTAPSGPASPTPNEPRTPTGSSSPVPPRTGTPTAPASPRPSGLELLGTPGTTPTSRPSAAATGGHTWQFPDPAIEFHLFGDPHQTQWLGCSSPATVTPDAPVGRTWILKVQDSRTREWVERTPPDKVAALRPGITRGYLLFNASARGPGEYRVIVNHFVDNDEPKPIERHRDFTKNANGTLTFR